MKQRTTMHWRLIDSVTDRNWMNVWWRHVFRISIYHSVKTVTPLLKISSYFHAESKKKDEEAKKTIWIDCHLRKHTHTHKTNKIPVLSQAKNSSQVSPSDVGDRSSAVRLREPPTEIRLCQEMSPAFANTFGGSSKWGFSRFSALNKSAPHPVVHCERENTTKPSNALFSSFS